MAFEGYETKPSVVIVYTGEGKGKTSASLGLTVRALGNDFSVSFIQFIKYWEVSEHTFIRRIQELYGDKLHFYKGGKGFYNAGDLSAKDVSEAEHKRFARETFEQAYAKVTSGEYGLVVCDEINNAVHDGLLEETDMEKLIDDKHEATSLCLTGRDFPTRLLEKADIATEMQKLKHHFDDRFLANKGIDY